MRKLFVFLLFTLEALFAQNIFYVSKNGNGNFTSIKEVNENMHLFKPGDKILFNRGEEFTDKKLNITVSGTKDSPIIFGAYGTGSKPVFHTKNYKATSWLLNVKGSYIIISDLEVINSRWIKAFDNSNHLTIENCKLHHFKTSKQLEADAKHVENEPLLIKNSDYFVLRKCIVNGNYNSVYQDMIMIDGNSQYALIENNYIDGGAHSSLYFRGYFKNKTDSEYNDKSPNHQIIRNNHFYNHSHHCLAVQRGSWATVIENNYFERSGTGIDSSVYYKRTYYHDGTIGSAIYFYGNGILRNNIIRKSGRQDGEGNKGIDGQARYIKIRSEVFDQSIYNNTFFENWAEGYKTGIYIKSGMPDNLKYENISFINNIFSKEKDVSSPSDLWIYKSGTKKNFNGEYRNNSFEKPKIKYGTGNPQLISIDNFNSSPPGNIIANGNLNISNPEFNNTSIIDHSPINVVFNNLALTPSSPLIDAGDYLTYTTNSGSNSNKIKVKDAKYFIDGWGIIEGDKIQLDNNIVRIVKVDYKNNILTIDQNISWSKNTGIALPYNGTKPDIGAVEYSGTAQNDQKKKTDSSQIATPTITNQPENQNTTVGRTISLSVSAKCNDEIGYQWWKNPFVSVKESKIVDNDKYSGATTNTLTINNLTESDNNTKYVCEVYNKKDHKNHWVNSQPAIITVTSTKNNFSSNTNSKLKVYLEGAFNNGKMRTTLLENNFLPKSQPFNNSIYNYTAFRKVNNLPNTIVDWLLIELRSTLTKKSKRFTALLKDDGNILNLDGSNNFTNQNIPDGEYYLVIYHRNHLPIMSSSKISVKNSTITYDFTTALNKAYGTNSMAKLKNGKFAMYAGDTDGNKIINDNDYKVIKNNIFSSGYVNGDTDLNGIVNVLDYSKINKNINIKSNVP